MVADENPTILWKAIGTMPGEVPRLKQTVTRRAQQEYDYKHCIDVTPNVNLITQSCNSDIDSYSNKSKLLMKMKINTALCFANNSTKYDYQKKYGDFVVKNRRDGKQSYLQIIETKGMKWRMMSILPGAQPHNLQLKCLSLTCYDVAWYCGCYPCYKFWFDKQLVDHEQQILIIKKISA